MSSDESRFLDTVVLLYFLLADEEELLGELIGWPFRVPFAVYDPEERAMPLESTPQPDLLSEMRQIVRYYDNIAASIGDTESLSKSIGHAESLSRVSRVDRLHDEGRLVAEAMDPLEQRLADQLQGPYVSQFGLQAPLGPGEAACVAIAHRRDWTLVTDDSDALKVLSGLSGDKPYRYERIRKLLVRAADERTITRDQANRIHAEMKVHGFWDSTCPFPQL